MTLIDKDKFFKNYESVISIYNLGINSSLKSFLNFRFETKSCLNNVVNKFFSI